MKESDFQTLFSKWLKYRFYKTGVFELKITKEDSIPFSAVKQHQRDALYFANHGNIVYKIPDDTIQSKPFDCLMMVQVPAYVVVMFYLKRGTKHFYLIPIDAWANEQDHGSRKSLTEKRAQEIGQLCTLE